jgi:inosine-uridine nucleoside N-ribohydrolase
LTFNQGVAGSSPAGLTNELNTVGQYHEIGFGDCHGSEPVAAMLLTRRKLLGASAGLLASKSARAALVHPGDGVGPVISQVSPIASLGTTPSLPRLILDNDYGGDGDCIGSLALALNQMQLGNCVIDSIMESGADDACGPNFADVCMRWAGNKVPVYKGPYTPPCPGPAGGYYTTVVVDTFGPALGVITTSACLSPLLYPDTTTGYRTQIANLITRKQKATIMTAGALTSVANLMQSGPDSISPLTGMEMIKAGVEQLYIMGGTAAVGPTADYNSALDPASAAHVIDNWPLSSIIGVDGFLGRTFGENFKATTPSSSNPFGLAYATSFSSGRPIWDVVATAIAIFGINGDKYDGGARFFNFRPGTQTVNASTGANSWVAGSGRYYYASHNTAIPKATIANWFQNMINFNGRSG